MPGISWFKEGVWQLNSATLTDLSLLVSPQTPPHNQFWKALRDKTAADNMTPIELSSIVLTLPHPNKMQDLPDITQKPSRHPQTPPGTLDISFWGRKTSI